MEESEHPEPHRCLHFWGNTLEDAYDTSQRIQSCSSFYTSPRGLSLFTRSWQTLPNTTPIRGLVFMIPDYGNDISWTFQATSIFLVQHGFACVALDLEGQGRSDGLKAFIPNVDLVVHDCIFFFTLVKQNPNFHNLPAFLFGESMGGAICLLVHLQTQTPSLAPSSSLPCAKSPTNSNRNFQSLKSSPSSPNSSQLSPSSQSQISSSNQSKSTPKSHRCLKPQPVNRQAVAWHGPRAPQSNRPPIQKALPREALVPGGALERRRGDGSRDERGAVREGCKRGQDDSNILLSVMSSVHFRL